MGERIYPPAPWIHSATCADAPKNLPTFKARDVMVLHPLGRPHHCWDKDAIVFNRDCVAEFVDWEQHQYAPSTIWPADATGPLCRTCHGTHDESRIAALTMRRREQWVADRP